MVFDFYAKLKAPSSSDTFRKYSSFISHLAHYFAILYAVNPQITAGIEIMEPMEERDERDEIT